MARFLSGFTGFLLTLALWLTGPVVNAAASEFDPGELGFSASVNGVVSPYYRFYGLARPGQPMPVSVVTPGTDRFTLTHSAGRLVQQGPASWLWHPPGDSGVYPATLSNLSTGEVMTLQLFVLTSLDEKQQGRIKGFRVGDYPPPRPGQAIDRKPAGLVEVTAANRGTWLSPHFRLEQFLSKQTNDYPMYVMVRPKLIIKLELLLGDVNRVLGIPADRFHVMSGYRTPFYNRTIKNVAYSRHLWGGAADIFVDMKAPAGRMDDLNGDGAADRDDARLLYDLASSLPERHRRPDLEGGTGLYGPNAWRGPFVHVDVRGTPARWGQ
ncbi:MAG: D-Ala-D-Ala carboxypeptidase family metallohydrolase [Oleiphilaceae bacterium]|nr:D-Ala-D-Ala carboxypeptidase family metallohydrolase [Oleiphilaceae bacterium]